MASMVIRPTGSSSISVRGIDLLQGRDYESISQHYFLLHGLAGFGFHRPTQGKEFIGNKGSYREAKATAGDGLDRISYGQVLKLGNNLAGAGITPVLQQVVTIPSATLAAKLDKPGPDFFWRCTDGDGCIDFGEGIGHVFIAG